MHTVRNISGGNYCETFAHLCGRRIFQGIIQANKNDPEQYEGSRLRTLLDETRSKVGNQVRLSAAGFADALYEVLREQADHFPRQVLFYAGVLLQEETIEVCTAGDIRVHLMKDDTLISMTRDHSMIEDPPDGAEHILSSMDREFLKSVPTRYIDATRRSPEPEVLRWSPEATGRLIICTSEFHKYRDPKSYLKSLLGMTSPESIPESSVPFGAVVIIDWDWTPL